MNFNSYTCQQLFNAYDIYCVFIIMVSTMYDKVI